MKWIRVEDDLPDKDEYGDKYGFVNCLVVVGATPEVREAMYNTNTKKFITRSFDNLDDAILTHWMPLPDLPEKE